MVEAAALLSPKTYLGHISAPLVLRMVDMHLDQVVLLLPFILVEMISGNSNDCECFPADAFCYGLTSTEL